MLNFLKKDLLLQLRDYKELLLLVGMPLLLIAILTFALGGFVGTSDVNLDLSAALVIEDDQAAGLEAFDADLAAAELPAAVKLQIGLAARAIRPVPLLREVLSGPELSEIATVREMSLAQAEAELADNDVKAVILVPEGYTRALLGSMLLEEEAGAELHLELSSAAPISASVFEGIVEGFASELNTRTALGRLGVDQAAQNVSPNVAVERVSGGRSIGSAVYYTFGMAVMFMLYVVGSISTRAHLEQENYAFDRILVSDARPIGYLMSKAFAGALVVVLQFAVLVTFGALLFGVGVGLPASFWLGVTVVVLTMALSVGALAALVTAVNFRLGNKTVSEAFNSIIVFVMALLGGSFLPLDQTAPALAAIGRWLPNGAAFDALLGLAGGAAFEQWGGTLFRLLLVGAALLVAAVAVFPKQRSA